MSDSEDECPLCMEPFDIDDKSFYPCKCGYQICRFCWHRIRTNENGLCPACRAEYPENPVEFKPVSQEEVQKLLREKQQKKFERKQKIVESRKHLANLRVVQKNLVYIIGLPTRLADEAVLRRQEFLGSYGKIIKIVVNRTPHGDPSEPTYSAYATFATELAAEACLRGIDRTIFDGRLIKASYGTTKYCSNFLKNQPCTNTECMYLHEVGDQAHSYTKEDMLAGKHTHDVMVTTENKSYSDDLPLPEEEENFLQEPAEEHQYSESPLQEEMPQPKQEIHHEQNNQHQSDFEMWNAPYLYNPQQALEPKTSTLPPGLDIPDWLQASQDVTHSQSEKMNTDSSPWIDPAIVYQEISHPVLDAAPPSWMVVDPQEPDFQSSFNAQSRSTFHDQEGVPLSVLDLFGISQQPTPATKSLQKNAKAKETKPISSAAKKIKSSEDMSESKTSSKRRSAQKTTNVSHAIEVKPASSETNRGNDVDAKVISKNHDNGTNSMTASGEKQKEATPSKKSRQRARKERKSKEKKTDNTQEQSNAKQTKEPTESNPSLPKKTTAVTKKPKIREIPELEEDNHTLYDAERHVQQWHLIPSPHFKGIGESKETLLDVNQRQAIGALGAAGHTKTKGNDNPQDSIPITASAGAENTSGQSIQSTLMETRVQELEEEVRRAREEVNILEGKLRACIHKTHI